MGGGVNSCAPPSVLEVLQLLREILIEILIEIVHPECRRLARCKGAHSVGVGVGRLPRSPPLGPRPVTGRSSWRLRWRRAGLGARHTGLLGRRVRG